MLIFVLSRRGCRNNNVPRRTHERENVLRGTILFLRPVRALIKSFAAKWQGAGDFLLPFFWTVCHFVLEFAFLNKTTLFIF